MFTAIDGYGWPGNVREMQAVFERAVLLASGGAIAAADLEIPVSARTATVPLSMQRAKATAIQNFASRWSCFARA